ncbi:ester cyclase [Kitasatospora sp. MBT63]|uniref:ester cyclase n=1 Tax=Kitasatospora sp. MBT63 TaxID=1444768 RepID=UPI0011EA64D9|nr:ester cyclase [Kitasatospora sp. MBT63]
MTSGGPIGWHRSQCRRRWRGVQNGRRRNPGRGGRFPPTSATVREIDSAVFRVEGDRIVEHWIQIDWAGLSAQLRAARAKWLLSFRA